jgi:hypothetical protein
MKPGRTITEVINKPDLLVYHITAELGSQWSFRMGPEQISIGAYYDGAMVIDDAKNKSIVGTIFEGFYDFSRHPELNTLRSWMTCTVTKEMKNWYCFHSEKYQHVALREYLAPTEIEHGTVYDSSTNELKEAPCTVTGRVFILT